MCTIHQLKAIQYLREVVCSNFIAAFAGSLGQRSQVRAGSLLPPPLQIINLRPPILHRLDSVLLLRALVLGPGGRLSERRSLI